MSDPRLSQNAARLSEDIGDVLSAIRRLIAEDEALTSARGGPAETAIDEDAGDFLARRYGGNAALARRLVGSNEAGEGVYRRPSRLADAVTAEAETAEGEDLWPLGGLANGADAARPQPHIMRHQIIGADASARPSASQNDLARQLSAAFRQEAAPEPRPDWPGDILRAADDRLADRAAAGHAAVEEAPAAQKPAVAPLRLDAARRVVNAPEPAPAPAAVATSGGWRGWIRPEPPLQRRAESTPAPAPASAPIAATPSPDVAGDDEDDFAEAFDWKARMRPDAEAQAPRRRQAAAVAPAPVARMARRSGWAAETPAQPRDEVSDFAMVFEALDAEASIAGNQRQPVASPIVRPAAPDDARIDPAPARRAAPAAEAVPEACPRPSVDVRVETAASVNRDAPSAAAPADPAPAAAAAAEHDTVTGLPPEVEEKCIRDLLREMIQEELHGELGERFSRNLRAVIRREVAAAIDEHLERF